MKSRVTPNASVDKTENGWRLQIPAGDSLHYRDAQLDDYFQLPRNKFPHHALTLSLRARASSPSIPGTWGFGLWNEPFGMSFGFGGNPFRLPILPNAIWFFSASAHNYLSFTNDKPAQGFLAQSFCAPKFHPLLIPAGLTFPFSRKWTRKLLSKMIREDSTTLDVDVTEWHAYKFEWSMDRSAFWLDDVLVFDSPVSPTAPLGLIIWIDNQFAAFTPEGKISLGVLEGKEEWLEVEDLVIGDQRIKV